MAAVFLQYNFDIYSLYRFSMKQKRQVSSQVCPERPSLQTVRTKVREFAEDRGLSAQEEGHRPQPNEIDSLLSPQKGLSGRIGHMWMKRDV
jgi:hypothetical protein